MLLKRQITSWKNQPIPVSASIPLAPNPSSKQRSFGLAVPSGFCQAYSSPELTIRLVSTHAVYCLSHVFTIDDSLEYICALLGSTAVTQSYTNDYTARSGTPTVSHSWLATYFQKCADYTPYLMAAVAEVSVQTQALKCSCSQCHRPSQARTRSRYTSIRIFHQLLLLQWKLQSCVEHMLVYLDPYHMFTKQLRVLYFKAWRESHAHNPLLAANFAAYLLTAGPLSVRVAPHDSISAFPSWR